MYVRLRIYTKMYDMPRIDVQQSTTMYDNLRKYTYIYEMMFNYVRQCTTKNTSFTCKPFFFNHGFSYEKVRITANNRDKLRQAAYFLFAPCLTLKVVSGTAPLPHVIDSSFTCQYSNTSSFERQHCLRPHT